MRNVATSSVRPDEAWAARRSAVGPFSDGVHLSVGSSYQRPVFDKLCLVYCGDDKCNCMRGEIRRSRVPLLDEVLGLILSHDPALYVVWRLNMLRVQGLGPLGSAPNFIDKQVPGTSLKLEGRRATNGVATYWEAGCLSSIPAEAELHFGPVFQTLTVRSRWSAMDTAPRDGRVILIWDGEEAFLGYRGDGMKRPDAWLCDVDDWEMIGEPLAWRKV